MLGFLVGLAAVLVYLDALPNAFVYDDNALVRFNTAIRDGSGLWSSFASDLWSRGGEGETNYYRPLPGMLFTVVHRAAGTAPWPYRLVNILLHALASILVFRLLRDLLRDRPPPEAQYATGAAFAGALLFAVHPAHVEAVAWVSGIMDVASTALALLAFDLYRRADTSVRGRVRLVAGLGAFLLAMLAKEPAALLPALLVLYDLLCRGVSRATLRAALVRWLPWFAVLGGYLALRAAALGGLAPHARPDLPGLSGSLLIAADLFARYVRTMFVPTRLSLGAFALPPEGWASLRGLVAIVVLLATAGLAWAGWRRHRAVLFGVAVFGLTLAPALYLPGLRPLLGKLFGERYLYFPSVGWAIVVACALGLAATRAGRAARVVWLAAALGVLVFAGLTLRQNRVWRSELTLWGDAVAKYPADGMNYLHYGTALIAAGQREEGRRVLDQGRVADPGIVAFHLEQGAGYLAAGRPRDAILKFERALALDPRSFEALLGAATAYEAAGWNEMAARRYQAALALRPEDPAARAGLDRLVSSRAPASPGPAPAPSASPGSTPPR